MKLLSILILLSSCSGISQTGSTNGSTVQVYQDRYQHLAKELNKESQKCIAYTKKMVREPIVEKKLDNNKFEFQFKNQKVKKKALKNYDPANFDWVQKAKLKTLYLDFPYDEKISKMHFEKATHLNDCANDFDNLNFISAVINELEKNKKGPSLYRQTLQRYFNYIKNNDAPLIAILTLDHIIQTLYEKQLIKIADPKAYMEGSNLMNSTYTKVGKSVLLGFKNDDYQKLYELDKELINQQKNFKRLIFQQISL